MESAKFYYNKWNGVGSPLGYAVYWLTRNIFLYKAYRSDLWFWNAVSFIIFLVFLIYFIFRFYLPGSQGKIGLTISTEKIDDPGHTREIYWSDVVSVKMARFSSFVQIETSDGALFKINTGLYTFKPSAIFKTFQAYYEKYGSSQLPGHLVITQ